MCIEKSNSQLNDEMDMLHALCTSNKLHIELAGGATCVFCLKYSDVSDIDTFVMDSGGPTAVCPHCEVDCMLPIIWDCSGTEMVDKDMLSSMQAYFF